MIVIVLVICYLIYYNRPKSPIVHICDNIYIGNWVDSHDLNLLKKKNIKKVISLTSHKKSSTILSDYEKLDIKHTSYQINDDEQFPLHILQDKIYNDIHKSSSRLLIHSYYGRGRTSAVMIIYMMKSRNMTFEQAYEYIIKKYPKMKLNPGFRQKLQAYVKL